MDWYEDKIEVPIRKTVKLLRDNGFNTECSCGHKMYVQCQYINDSVIMELDNLLFNNDYRNYTITVKLSRLGGHLHNSYIDIQF